MKKTLLLVAVPIAIGMAVSITGRAQFDKGSMNTMANGIILMKDGTIKKLDIKMEHPDFMKKPNLPLITSEGPMPKSLLQSFSYLGRPWVFQNSPIGEMWVIHDVQGAINRYVYVSSESEGKNWDVITTGQYFAKGDERVISTELTFAYKKKMGALVSDYPELAAKVETGYGAGLPEKVAIEYNSWYEKANPGKLKYLPVEFGMPIPGGEMKKEEPKGFSLKAFGAVAKESQAKDKAASTQQLDDQFAGRSATPSAEYASAKDNVQVKKETFAAKIQRIKADGNKVGVYFKLRRVHVNNPDYKGSSFESPVSIDGEINEESLQGAGKELVDELNAALQTADIELIDISNVPYRDARVFGISTRIDDFWASKYKLVFAYTLDLEIRAVRTSMPKEQFEARLRVNPSMLVTEYLGAKDATKQDIQASVMNMGYFESPAVQQAENITDIGTLYNEILPKLKAPLAEMVKTQRVEGVNRLVKKVAD